jgi:hypothetical protein
MTHRPRLATDLPFPYSLPVTGYRLLSSAFRVRQRIPATACGIFGWPQLLATGVAQPHEVARVTAVDLLRLAPPRLASNLGHPGSASRASTDRDNYVLPGFVGAPGSQ